MMLGWALFFLSLFLILLILVQRGKGGGLTGALGGPGGQSAFGTKAGDLFTKITSFTALGWIALCAFTMWLIGSHGATVAIDPDTPRLSPTPAEQRSGSPGTIDFGDESSAADPAGVLTPAELTPATEPTAGEEQPALSAAEPAAPESAPEAAPTPDAAETPAQPNE
ncbi:MAG: preprotein translocase subunit SecG [Planctomycetaceae bacterium]|nr:MAG: preprotein translocase subunit SecG [Planctomycetaceae bacterium]